MRLESRTSTLQELYAEESAKIRRNFEDSGDGKAAIRSRCSLIDSVVIQLWSEVTATGEPLAGFCIAAMGGYGRRALFPYSDIDLLVVFDGIVDEVKKQKARVARDRLKDHEAWR